MRKKKSRKTKFHISAGRNARLNVENLKVINHYFLQKKMNEELVQRITKNPNLRNMIIYVPDKDYQVMLLDIKKMIKLSADTFQPILYLFADGIMVAQIHSIKLKPKEEKVVVKEESKDSKE